MHSSMMDVARANGFGSISEAITFARKARAALARIAALDDMMTIEPATNMSIHNIARSALRAAHEPIAKKNAEIERLQNEVAHLTFCLNSRDDFLGKIDQWNAYISTLPRGKAGVPGGWSDKPPVNEQNVGDLK